MNFLDKYNELINKDIYISKNMIDNLLYNENLNIDLTDLEIYANIGKATDKHNCDFLNNKLIEYKSYFDDMFKDIDSNILLDEEQRKIIMSDDDNTLVIAGAGSGKTTTIMAKIKYLVDKLNIKPEEILIISFTNKVTEELKEKINNSFNINTPIYTFHKLGLKILEDSSKIKYKIIDSKEIDDILEDYFFNYCFKDKKELKKIYKNFKKYLNITNKIFSFKCFDDYYKSYINSLYYKNIYHLKKYNDLKIKDNLKILKGIDGITYSNKIDALVANMLYIENYSYKYDNVFYLFDDLLDKYKINKYNLVINDNYLESIIDFIKLLFKHKKESKKNKTEKEIFYKLMFNSKEDSCKEFINLVKNFIFKIKSKNISIDEIIKNNHSFKEQLEVLKNMYNYYNSYKELTHLIDFEDIIILAYEKLDNINLKYKYLIIDEYQDISKCRYLLVKKMIELFNIKLFAVGDDFQAIYSFSGSDVNLFTDFYNLMGHASLKKITNTYRNSQELIDMAGSFVMKNKNQIFKKLVSNKHVNKPIEVYFYENKILVLKNIIDKIYSENNNSKILLLGRYKSDISTIIDNNYFKVYKDKVLYTDLNIYLDFMTIHASKGLGSDNVIIINLNSGKMGFPSLKVDDDIINILNSNCALEEERRLFYVALTRTKNKVYLMCPKDNVSTFYKELSTYDSFKENSIVNLTFE